jgi:hypothetical protein
MPSTAGQKRKASPIRTTPKRKSKERALVRRNVSDLSKKVVTKKKK